MEYKVLKYQTPYPVFLSNDLENLFTTFKASDHFLRNNKEYIETINLYLEVYRDLFDLIPELVWNFGSGHIFPYTESEYELESSVILAILGFYKQAINSLRNVLELGLLSIYYNVEDKGHIEIKNWLHSLEDTPFRKTVFNGLLKNKNILEFENRMYIFDEIDNLYKELCNYTHTKGFHYSSRSLGRSNINRWNEKSFKQWLNMFRGLVRIIVTLHLLKYPIGLQYTPIDEKFGLNGPVGGFLNPHQVNRIKEIFDKDSISILQEISDKDEWAANAAKEINEMPDITSQEFQKQIEEQDKFMIENMGFKNWLRNEHRILDTLKESRNKKEYELRLRYIEKMRKWAQSKNLV